MQKIGLLAGVFILIIIGMPVEAEEISLKEVLNIGLANSDVVQTHREELNLAQLSLHRAGLPGTLGVAIGGNSEMTFDFIENGNFKFDEDAHSESYSLSLSFLPQAGASFSFVPDSSFQVGICISPLMENSAKKQAEFELDIQRHLFELSILEFESSLKQKYIDTYSAQTDLKFTEKNLLILRKSFEVAKSRLDSGLISGKDFDDGKRSLYDGEAALVQARKDYRLAITGLSRYIGMSILDSTLAVPLIEEDILNWTPPEKSLLVVRLKELKEYLVALKETERAVYDLKQSRLFWKPDFSISPGINASNSGTEEDPDWQWMPGLSLSLNFRFSGSEIMEIEQQEINVDRSERRQNSAYEDLAISLDSAYLDYELSLMNLESSRYERETAEKERARYAFLYEKGDIFEHQWEQAVLDVERALFQEQKAMFEHYFTIQSFRRFLPMRID